MASSGRAEVSDHLAASSHAEERWAERIGAPDLGPVEAYQDGTEVDTAVLPGIEPGRARYHWPTGALLLSNYNYVDERRVITTVLLVETCHVELRHAVTEEVSDRDA